MGKINVECKNFHSESEIREEKLMFSEDKITEEAYCPECEEKIYEGETVWVVLRSESWKKRFSR